MTRQEIIKLTNELIGQTRPIGDSHFDERVSDNLETAIWVVEDLMTRIRLAANEKSNPLASRKKVGKKADAFLQELAKELLLEHFPVEQNKEGCIDETLKWLQEERKRLDEKLKWLEEEGFTDVTHFSHYHENLNMFYTMEYIYETPLSRLKELWENHKKVFEGGPNEAK